MIGYCYLGGWWFCCLVVVGCGVVFDLLFGFIVLVVDSLVCGCFVLAFGWRIACMLLNVVWLLDCMVVCLLLHCLYGGWLICDWLLWGVVCGLLVLIQVFCCVLCGG